MTYVFDSVIGANFNAYLRQVSELRNTVATDDFTNNSEREFTSIFALRDSHSELLDCILRGCFLRTPQRAAGDALREILELILRFGALVTNIRRGTVREAAGAEDLSELYGLFQTQMLFLVSDSISLIRVAYEFNSSLLDDRSRPFKQCTATIKRMIRRLSQHYLATCMPKDQHIPTWRISWLELIQLGGGGVKLRSRPNARCDCVVWFNVQHNDG